jgi:DNA-binding protein HU-beta
MRKAGASLAPSRGFRAIPLLFCVIFVARIRNPDQFEQGRIDPREMPMSSTIPAKPAKAAAAPKKAAAKGAAPATVTLKHIAAELAESHDLPKKQAEAVLNDLVSVTAKHLKKGDKIRLTGLGILQVRKRPARMGRNPATGEQIKIKASKKVAFRAAKELKESV